jgi:exodeoxyribonuclease VII small subunit
MADQTYEEMIKSIEELLGELDHKDIPLDDAVTKYKKGIELIEACTQKLESIEKELRVIE